MAISQVFTTEPVLFTYYSVKTNQYGGETLLNDYKSNPHVSPAFNHTRSRDPDYRLKIAKKVDASAPFYNQKTSLRGSTGFFQGSIGPGKPLPLSARWLYPGITSSTLVGLASADDVALKNQAVIRLKQKLASQTAQWNALPFLGESKEMYALVGDINKSLSKTVRLLLNLKKSTARDVAKVASDLWLTQSFAINPLLSDLESLGDALARYSTGDNDTPAVVRAGASSTRVIQHLERIGFGNGFYLTSRGGVAARLQYQLTAGFDVKLRTANSYTVGNQFGFSMGEILPTLWELQAFSWVADYFATVGDWLSDLAFDDGGATRYCTMFKKVELIGNLDLGHEIPSIATGFDRWSSKRIQLKFKSGQRIPLGQLPRVRLYWKTSGGVASNGINRLLNLASLLVK